jgi:endonuclease/exonuclease/phosphatase family metal-dependent hydrolase
VEALKLSRRPDGEDPFERVLLSACFELPSGPLHIFNAHFSWVKEQLEDNLAEALPFIQRPNNPAMLMGDFNAPAGQGLLYLLGEAGWVDAWKELHPGEPGPTFEAGQPTLRIDYMWSNAHLAPYIRDISILGAGPHHLSDHLGLISTLDF